jgi:tetratricopeptide (TPR) repeat protein
MSLLIKALNKAEEAQAQNAKTEEAQAQKENTAAQAQQVKTEAQAQNSKSEAQADKQKSVRDSAKQKQAISKNTTEYASDMVLSLSPATKPIEETTIIDEPELVNALLADAGVVNSGPALSASPKNAANVFTAKGKERGAGNKNLAIIAGLALFALLGMGAYFYHFIDNTPETAAPARAIVAQPAQPATLPEALQVSIYSAPIAQEQVAVNPAPEPAKQSAPAETSAFESRKSEPRQNEARKLAQIQAIETRITSQKRAIKKSEQLPDLVDDEMSVNADVAIEPEDVAEISETDSKQVEANQVDIIQVDAPIITNKKTRKLKTGQSSAAIASKSASISVSRSKAQSGVNPTLMSAYEAYNAGKDSVAQKLYKKVLQHDVRNVDALLGLGAIAQRQGRAADANGWYGKVLEVEPRNSIAQAALIDSQPQGNELNNETHLKNMLAKQPDDANLHVALGNLYAEQNQWPAAQQAYFDAYRLHANADNAFNLAVSLDQMGKPKLALPYYQRALSLAQTGTNGIDKAALEARIAAIQ